MLTLANGIRDLADELAVEFLKNGANAGLAVGVIAGGERFTFGYGKLRRDADAVPNEHTVFEIASVTKTFTATLLAEMAARGEVSLNQPVQELLPPEVKLPTYGGRPITLAQLSEHTSALPRLPDNMQATVTDQQNPYKDYQVSHLHEYLNGAKLAFPPGSGVAYSNLATGLLGHALGLKGGKPFEELMAERVLRPLGMNDTAVTLSDDQKGRMAQGHDESGKPTSNWDTPSLGGAGALRSTVSELLTYLQANLTPAATPLKAALEACHADRPVAWWRRVPVGGGVAVALAAVSLLLQWWVPVPPGSWKFFTALMLPVVVCLFWKGLWSGVTAAVVIWAGSLLLWKDDFGWVEAGVILLVLLGTVAKFAGYLQPSRSAKRIGLPIGLGIATALAVGSLVAQKAVPVPPGSMIFLAVFFLPILVSLIGLGFWPGVLAFAVVWGGSWALWGQNFGWQAAGTFTLTAVGYAAVFAGMRPLNRAMLGWQESSAGGAKVWWHNGGTGGFASFVAFSRSPDVAVAVLANSANVVDYHGGKLLEHAQAAAKAEKS